jgi:protoheme ferro-lyase
MINLKKIQSSPILPIVLVGASGVAIYVVYKAIKGTTNLLDITKSKADKQVLKEITSSNNPFSITYWKSFTKGNVKILKEEECERLRKIIVNSISKIPFMTNNSAIFSVFKALKYKTQVSFFADYFLKKENIDLLTYIKFGYTFFWTNTGIDDTTSKAILQYVNNLPTGNTK